MENEEIFKESLDNKVLNNKWFWIVLIIVIVLIVLFAYRIYTSSILYQYSSQAIEVLQDFKNGKITAKEAHDKIDAIDNRLDEEAKEDDDIKLLELNTILMSASWELTKDDNSMDKDSFTITEVENYTLELKRIR